MKLMSIKKRRSSARLLLIGWSILPWGQQWGNGSQCYESNIPTSHGSALVPKVVCGTSRHCQGCIGTMWSHFWLEWHPRSRRGGGDNDHAVGSLQYINFNGMTSLEHWRLNFITRWKARRSSNYDLWKLFLHLHLSEAVILKLKTMIFAVNKSRIGTVEWIVKIRHHYPLIILTYIIPMRCQKWR